MFVLRPTTPKRPRHRGLMSPSPTATATSPLAVTSRTTNSPNRAVWGRRDQVAPASSERQKRLLMKPDVSSALGSPFPKANRPLDVARTDRISRGAASWAPSQPVASSTVALAQVSPPSTDRQIAPSTPTVPVRTSGQASLADSLVTSQPSRTDQTTTPGSSSSAGSHVRASAERQRLARSPV